MLDPIEEPVITHSLPRNSNDIEYVDAEPLLIKEVVWPEDSSLYLYTIGEQAKAAHSTCFCQHLIERGADVELITVRECRGNGILPCSYCCPGMFVFRKHYRTYPGPKPPEPPKKPIIPDWPDNDDLILYIINVEDSDVHRKSCQKIRGRSTDPMPVTIEDCRLLHYGPCRECCGDMIKSLVPPSPEIMVPFWPEDDDLTLYRINVQGFIVHRLWCQKIRSFSTDPVPVSMGECRTENLGYYPCPKCCADMLQPYVAPPKMWSHDLEHSGDPPEIIIRYVSSKDDVKPLEPVMLPNWPHDDDLYFYTISMWEGVAHNTCFCSVLLEQAEDFELVSVEKCKELNFQPCDVCCPEDMFRIGYYRYVYEPGPEKPKPYPIWPDCDKMVLYTIDDWGGIAHRPSCPLTENCKLIPCTIKECRTIAIFDPCPECCLDMLSRLKPSKRWVRDL